MGNKAIFLDRDGTIIVDRGYLRNPDEIQFISGVPEMLGKMKKDGFLLIVLTNQSGVARGYFSEDVVKIINAKMKSRLLEEYGVVLDAIYYCPHHKDGIGKYRQGCNCRKPNPGMVLQAQRDFNIDLKKSVMVGDKDSDHIKIEELDFLKIEKDMPWTLDGWIRQRVAREEA